mgnify:CR=1 FL=1
MDYEKIKIAVYDITDDVKSQTKIAVYSLPKFIEEINLAPEFWPWKCTIWNWKGVR